MGKPKRKTHESMENGKKRDAEKKEEVLFDEAVYGGPPWELFAVLPQELRIEKMTKDPRDMITDPNITVFKASGMAPYSVSNFTPFEVKFSVDVPIVSIEMKAECLGIRGSYMALATQTQNVDRGFDDEEDFALTVDMTAEPVVRAHLHSLVSFLTTHMKGLVFGRSVTRGTPPAKKRKSKHG